MEANVFPARDNKRLLAIGTLVGMVTLQGCQTTNNLKSPEAEMVREVMSTHCVTGLRSGALYIQKGHVKKDLIYVHSIRELDDGWKVADISGQRVRDNFYYNMETAEYACSTTHRQRVLNHPNDEHFPSTHLITQTRSTKYNPRLTLNNPDTMNLQQCLKPDGAPFDRKLTKTMCDYLGGRFVSAPDNEEDAK